MPLEATEQRKLAAIMFTDMVGYSALSQRDEKLAQELLEEHREILREIFPRFHGTEIKTIGDAFLVEFGSALEAAQCAIEIQRTLAKRNADIVPDQRIEVKIGVHIGDVIHRGGDVYGDGVNIASRIEPIAEPGGICVSMDVERHTRNALEARFEKLAPTELKNISVAMDLFRIVLPWETRSEVRSEIRRGEDHKSEISRSSVSSVRSRWIWAAALIVLLLAGLLGYQLRRTRNSSAPQQSETATAASLHVSEKSIAVLPFENLSEDKSNAFFADGVQDEILTRLSRIADLKVISRSSVMHYRSGVERNLRKIAEELGVAHMLEGSVQRAANKVRVNAQLIDARNDSHLWAQTYDRDLADVFAIQSEIAKAIADQLQAKLSPTEKTAIEQAPTTNVAAFDLFSRAHNLVLDVSFTAIREDNLRQAIDLLNQAVAADPNFFPAYVSLAEAHDILLGTIGVHTPEQLALAETAVARLRDLRPDAGETHLALARHRYYVFRDYAGARSELTKAAGSLPNEPAILSLAGFIDRRADKWDESVRESNRAIDLDPRNIFLMQQTAISYQYLRRYSEMAKVLDRALAIDPERADTKIARAQVELHWHADAAPLEKTIQTIVTANPTSAAAVAENWILASLCQRNADELAQALTALGKRTFSDNSVRFDSSFAQALVKYLRRDSAGFKDALKIARISQDQSVRRYPDAAREICALGVIDAMLGNKEDALKEGRQAMELTPITKDALAGSEIMALFAVICAWADEKDLAIAQLNTVTQRPCYLTYGLLKLSPYWDPLRGDPRFEQIVDSLSPK